MVNTMTLEKKCIVCSGVFTPSTNTDPNKLCFDCRDKRTFTVQMTKVFTNIQNGMQAIEDRLATLESKISYIGTIVQAEVSTKIDEIERRRDGDLEVDVKMMVDSRMATINSRIITLQDKTVKSMKVLDPKNKLQHIWR